MAFLYILFAAAIPFSACAQEVYNEVQGIYSARVLRITDAEIVEVPGTDTVAEVQTLTARILEGPQKGKEITFQNDYQQLKEGSRFFIRHLKTIDGVERYTVADIDRRGPLIILGCLFAGMILWLSGKQGVRSLISLIGSILVIIYVLLPGLLAGYSPVLISIGIAVAILCAAIFLTHGINRESIAAFLGTISAICLTGFFAYFAVHITQLTGFASEEAVYLNIHTDGVLDFAGLLLGGIIIGILGVLDDIAVTQAVVVGELYRSNAEQNKWNVYKRALHVGREHVGALVNTLALAYTGSALPLLLLFSESTAKFSLLINQEIIATEIVRTIVGSIGLILTVPITTFIAVYLLKDQTGQEKHISHSHSHHSH